MPNNPIPDAELAEVKRLVAAATPGKMSVDRYHTLLDKDGKHVLFTGIQTPMTSGERQDQARANMAEYAALHNAFGPILARLEAAERERDERTTMAARAQEALRYVMNGLPTNDAVWAAYGNSDSARAWLAARDAKQRREGAVMKLLDMSLGDLAWDGTDLRHEAESMIGDEKQYQTMLAEAQRLREGGE